MPQPRSEHQYTFSTGRTLTLINDHILVAPDPETYELGTSGLVRPQGAYEHVYACGTIRAVGVEKELLLADTARTHSLRESRPLPDLHVGDRCCFIRFHAKASSNMLFSEFGDGMLLLRARDLLFLMDEGETIELGQ